MARRRLVLGLINLVVMVGVAGARDLAGNPLAAGKVWTFKTAR